MEDGKISDVELVEDGKISDVDEGRGLLEGHADIEEDLLLSDLGTRSLGTRSSSGVSSESDEEVVSLGCCLKYDSILIFNICFEFVF